jgi:hypothetical protein
MTEEFGIFKKTNQALDAELIGKDELASSQNVVLDRKGYTLRAVKRGGFTRFNTNSAGSSIKSLHDVKDEEDNNFILSVIGTALKKSADGTGAFTDVKTGLTSGLKVRLVSYNGKIYVTNGIDSPFILQDENFATLVNQQIEPPDIRTIYSGHITPGNLTADSKYQYRMAYLTDTGEMSRLSLPFTHIAGPTIGSSTPNANANIYFNGVPVSSDPRVTRKIIFRSQAVAEGGSWNPATLYHQSTIPNDHTVFLDDVADADLVIATTVTLITKVNSYKYPAIHKERLVAGHATIAPKEFAAPIFSGAGTIGSGYTDNPLPVQLSASTGAGALTLLATYKYRIVFYNEEDDLESDHLDLEITLSGTENTVQLINFPTYFDPDPNIAISLRIYRTAANGSVYKLHPATDDLILTGDVTADGSLGADYAEYTEEKSGYIIYGEIGTFQFNVANIASVYPDDSDAIMGVFDEADGFVVFKENSICKFYTGHQSPANWQAKKVSPKIGASSDEICQNGREYLFIFQGKPYLWSDGSYPNMIAGNYEPVFDTVTSINSITYSSKKSWYLISAIIGGAYYLLCYDTKLKDWYKFSITKADALLIKEHGTSAGAILQANGNFITKYNEDSEVDNEAGADVEISTSIRTKTFIPQDGISKGRSRYLHLRYVKKSSQDVVVTITDPFNSTSKTYNDASGSGEKQIELDTDTMTGTLKEYKKVYFDMTNFNKFLDGRFESDPVRRD